MANWIDREQQRVHCKITGIHMETQQQQDHNVGAVLDAFTDSSSPNKVNTMVP
jgi:hypothetical protein